MPTKEETWALNLEKIIFIKHNKLKVIQMGVSLKNKVNYPKK